MLFRSAIAGSLLLIQAAPLGIVRTWRRRQNLQRSNLHYFDQASSPTPPAGLQRRPRAPQPRPELAEGSTLSTPPRRRHAFDPRHRRRTSPAIARRRSPNSHAPRKIDGSHQVPPPADLAEPRESTPPPPSAARALPQRRPPAAARVGGEFLAAARVW